VWLAEDDVGVAHARLVEKIFRDHKTKYRLAAWAMGSGSAAPERGAIQAPAEDLHLGLIGLVAILLLCIALQRREPDADQQSAVAPDATPNTESWLDDLMDSGPDAPHPWIAKAYDLRKPGGDRAGMMRCDPRRVQIVAMTQQGRVGG